MAVARWRAPGCSAPACPSLMGLASPPCARWSCPHRCQRNQTLPSMWSCLCRQSTCIYSMKTQSLRLEGRPSDALGQATRDLGVPRK